MHPVFTYELAQHKIRELHRQAEIERLARRATEIELPEDNPAPKGWLRRLVGRLATA